MNIKVFRKRMACLLAAFCILFSYAELFTANAADSSITISKYSGDVVATVLVNGDDPAPDVQAAFDKASDGCVITFNSAIKLNGNVDLEAAVMFSGYNRVNLNGYKIRLVGGGALFSHSKLTSKYRPIAPDGYEVVVEEVAGGYVYSLNPIKTPSFTGEDGQEISPGFKTEGALNGATVNEEAKTLYLDAAVSGITTADMKNQTMMATSNPEAIEFSFEGAVNGYVVNGTVMVMTAGNAVDKVTAEKKYTIILLGDVNANGKVDAADAHLIACYANGSMTLEGNALLAADANQKDGVTAADAETICTKYVRSGS